MKVRYFILRPMKKTQILHTGLNKLLNIVLYFLGAHLLAIV